MGDGPWRALLITIGLATEPYMCIARYVEDSSLLNVKAMEKEKRREESTSWPDHRLPLVGV
jgi:hypothetical protein